MIYNNGELIVFMYGLQSGNIATIGTVVSSRPLKNYPDIFAYTIYHPWVDLSYEYAEEHLKNSTISAKDYVQRYGGRLPTQRVGLNAQ